AAARGQYEIEMVDDLGNAAIVEQAYPDDEPHHVVGGQLPPPHRRGAGCRQRIGDPLRIDRRAELRETRRALACARGEDGLPHLHRPTSRGGDQLLPCGQRIQNPAPYTLTDRHWLQRGDSPFARTSPLPGASTSLQPFRKELPCRDEPKVARREDRTLNGVRAPITASRPAGLPERGRQLAIAHSRSRTSPRSRPGCRSSSCCRRSNSRPTRWRRGRYSRRA